MGRAVDRGSRLAEKVFAYRQSKDGTLLISRQGRVVTTRAGRHAIKLSAHLERAGPERVQLLLAKATGNFKRGNERTVRPT